MKKIRTHMNSTYFFQCLIDNIWMLKVVIREEVKLIEEVTNVDTAKWIHLRKWEHTWKSDLRGE